VIEEEVRFGVDGETCVGTVFRPGGRTTGIAPCVVLANGVTMTRRDGVDRVAREFAAHGFIALTFDPRHLGDSDGQPRQLIDTGRQVEDLRAAVRFARDLPGVDAHRVALWGFSLGGGCALAVAGEDPAVAAVILVCPVVDGLAYTVAGDRVNGRKIAWASARALLARRHVRFPVVAAPGEVALFTQREAAPGFEASIGAESGWRNEVVAWPTRLVVSFRPIRRAAHVRCPLLASVATADTLVPRGPIEQVARRAPRGHLTTHPMGHFGVYGEHFDDVVSEHLQFLDLHLGSPTEH